MQVPFAGVIAGQEEKDAVLRVMDGTWLGHGTVADEFEKEFAEYIGVKYAILVNSGSSANMLALAGLNLPKVSKVIVAGGGFPATLNPLLHLGYEPVIVDLDRQTHQIDLDQVEKVCKVDTKDRPDAIIFAHTLGIPVDMTRMMEIAKRYHLRVIEDCCEALGATFDGKQVGSFGTTATFSFYPSHQMTALGGGGMVVTNDKEIALRMKSMREWGKRQVEPGFEGEYFTEFESSKLPDGTPYGRNYIYDTIGWNFKYPEANAAYGLENFRRMQREDWKGIRYANYLYLRDYLKDTFDTPMVPSKAFPASFGYCLTLKKDAPITRDELVTQLEAKGIHCRPFFAGNILKQPAYLHMKAELPVSDYLTKNSFFIGTWPGLTKEHLDYVVQAFQEILNGK